MRVTWSGCLNPGGFIGAVFELEVDMKVIGYVLRSGKNTRWVYEIDNDFFSCTVGSDLYGENLLSALENMHLKAMDAVCGERWLRLAELHGH